MSGASFSSIENVEADGWAETQQRVAPAFRERFDLRVQRIAGAVTLFAPKVDSPMQNRVWLPGSAVAVTPEALEEIRNHARSLGKTRFLAECPTWAAAPALMAEHKFRQRPATLMKLARRTTTDVPSSALRIEEVGADDAESFGQLAAQAMEFDSWMSDGFNSTVGVTGWTHYVVLDGDSPMAVAGLRAHEGYAWCCFGATLPAYRGRGAQLALLNRRIRDAAKAGCDWIVAEAHVGSTSLRNQQRAGFEVVYERPNYVAELTL